MLTVHKDDNSVYIIVGGWIVRPPYTTSFKEGYEVLDAQLSTADTNAAYVQLCFDSGKMTAPTEIWNVVWPEQYYGKSWPVGDLEGKPLFVGDLIWDKQSGLQVHVVDDVKALQDNGFGGTFAHGNVSWRKNGCWTRTTPDDWRLEELAELERTKTLICNYAPLCEDFTSQDVCEWTGDRDSESTHVLRLRIDTALTQLMEANKLQQIDEDTYKWPAVDAHKPLHHPKDEEALDTIDALMFSGGPVPEDLPRIQHMLRRWEKELRVRQKLEVELKQDEEDPS